MKFEPIYEIEKWKIIQRDELTIARVEEYFETNPAYLYCILSRNRISINQDYIDFSDKHVSLEFLINNKGVNYKEQFKISHDYEGLKELKIISEYPYNHFSIQDENGTALYGGKASYFPENLYTQVKNKELLDYEILYIGQSVSKDNNPVLKRTLSHSTFQKILEDYNHSHPDKELFLFFFSFKQKTVLDFSNAISLENSKKMIENYSKNYFTPTITEIKQNVSLFEAGLINYFKPKYNSDFVNHVPSKTHTSFKGLHEMNLHKLRIMFGAVDFAPRLYTDTSGRKEEHEIEVTITKQ